MRWKFSESIASIPIRKCLERRMMPSTLTRLIFFLLFSLALDPALGVANAAGTLTTTQAACLDRAVEGTLSAFKNKDGKALASWVKAGQGLRFIPYPWDELQETVVLDPRQVEKLFQTKSKKVWGKYDGSGDPIRLAPPEYARKFIWNVDYSKIGDRQRQSLPEHLEKNYAYRGTNEDVLKIFPQAWTVSIFYPGITGPQGGAMDWSWLTLVFTPKGECWELAGVVHKEWTI
jgi:hypothetical protein